MSAGRNGFAEFSQKQALLTKLKPDLSRVGLNKHLVIGFIAVFKESLAIQVTIPSNEAKWGSCVSKQPMDSELEEWLKGVLVELVSSLRRFKKESPNLLYSNVLALLELLMAEKMEAFIHELVRTGLNVEQG